MCIGRSIQPALLEVIIQFNSSHCGLQLSAIRIPERCALLGIVRRQQIIPISENPSILIGNLVLAIAYHPMFAPALKIALQRSHPVYYSLNDCLLEHHVPQARC
jgi:Trk K+ transport system NAD-binding subunit